MFPAVPGRCLNQVVVYTSMGLLVWMHHRSSQVTKPTVPWAMWHLVGRRWRMMSACLSELWRLVHHLSRCLLHRRAPTPCCILELQTGPPWGWPVRLIQVAQMKRCRQTGGWMGCEISVEKFWKFRLLACYSCRQQGHAGSKTLIKQNPLVFLAVGTGWRK